MQDEMTYPAPPNTSSSGYVPPRPPRPTALIVATAALAVAFIAVAIFAGVQTAELGVERDDNLALTTELQDGVKALTAAEGTNAELEEDLAAARSKATSCAEAADLLARGANGYADLWNGLDDAADEFRFIFDFYLRSIMRRTNVPNAVLGAGWDALDECEAGGADTVSLA